MPSIRQLRSGAWQVRYRNGSRQEKTHTCDTHAAATAAAGEIARALKSGEKLANSGENLCGGSHRAGTIGRLFDVHEALFASHARNYRTWRYRAKYWLEQIGRDTPAGDVTVADITRIILNKRRSVSGATARQYLALISQIYDGAELLDDQFAGLTNPCARALKLLRHRRHAGDHVLCGSRHRERRPTTDEMRELLHGARACKRPYGLEAVILFAASTGLRRRELTQLTWSDIDRTHTPPLAHVRHDPAAGRWTKTRLSRIVPLVPDAMAALSMLEHPRHAGARLFPINPDTLTRAFTRLCHRMGIHDLKFHDLRHEALSRASEMYGVTAAELQLMSGHRTRAQLDRYVHADEEQLYRKLRRLSKPTLVRVKT